MRLYTFEYVLCGMYGIPYKGYMYICCTRGMFCMPLLLHMRVACAQLLDISAPPLDRCVSSVVCSHCAIPVVQTPVLCIRCPLGSATYLVTFIDWYCNTVFRHNMYIHMYVWCSMLGSPAVPFCSISTVVEWTAHSTRQCYFNECVLLTRDCLPASCHACTRAHLLTIGLITTH